MSEVLDKNKGVEIIKGLYRPDPTSHKGQNGKVMVIGGSHLFHAASLWALEVASRIVDMVFYSSVAENNELVKAEFKNGIVVPREKIDDYIDEADCILVGPGMERTEISNVKTQMSKPNVKCQNLKEIAKIEDSGLRTYALTEYLLRKYPEKRWVIDAGSLQMIEPELLPKNCIITPHRQEFELLQIKDQRSKIKTTDQISKAEEQVIEFAKNYVCVVLLKGQEDIVCDSEKCVKIPGGNAGMTKGGTGDVLAGLVTAFYAKNLGFESAVGASFLNKLAGDSLFEKQNYMFNASDLAREIPGVYKECLAS